jgi:ABC-type glycerol-3-phosphate transport system substrate-binding protein
MAMDGDVIFNKDTASAAPQQNTAAPSAGNTEIPLDQLPHDIKSEGPAVKPVDAPKVPPTPPPPPSGGFPTGLIVKIILGIVGFVVVLFLIFRLILPMFSKSTSDKEVTLTYWGLWESENTMSVLISDFEKDHPKIKIKYIKQDPEQYAQKLQAQIGTPSGPDIYRYHNTWAPMLRADLAPIPQSVITPKEFKNLYYPVITEDLASEGPIYGVPLEIDTLALFINPEIARDFDAPTNWIEFQKEAVQLTVANGDGTIETAGAALGSMENVNHAPDILSMMMIQNGADLYGNTGSEKSQKNIASALQFYASFSNSSERTWSKMLEPSLDAFAHEKLAMYFGYSWDIYQIQALNPNLKFEIHPVPGIPGGSKDSVASYWVEGVSSKSTHQKEAMEFMKFLTQKQTLQQFYESAAKTREFGELYPMPSLGKTLSDNPLIYPFIQQASTAQSTYFVSDTFNAPIDEQMNTYLTDAFNAILKEPSSLDSAVTTLVQGIDTVKKQYNF